MRSVTAIFLRQGPVRRSAESRLGEQRVRHAGLGESSGPQHAAVAAAARLAVGATDRSSCGQPVVEAERQAAADDLGLRQADERRVDREAGAFDAGLRRERGHPLERLDELRPAVGIAGVVEGVHADDDVRRAEGFGPGQRERQEHGVARRHVGRRDAGVVDGAVLRHGPAPVSDEPPKAREVELKLDVARDAEGRGDPPGGLEFAAWRWP